MTLTLTFEDDIILVSRKPVFIQIVLAGLIFKKNVMWIYFRFNYIFRENAKNDGDLGRHLELRRSSREI